MASKPSEGEAGASRGNLSREPIPGGLPRAAATTSGAGSPHRTCAGPNKRWHWAGSPTAQQLATSATISPSAPAKSDLRGRAAAAARAPDLFSCTPGESIFKDGPSVDSGVPENRSGSW